MNDVLDKITSINIEEELKNSYLDYAMSVIIGRALPDVRDGLKPVHRRILFAMYILNNDWNKPYKKSARIVGDVIGKYHPHGDVAVYETMVRMAQSFSLRYTLIDGQGNFGSIDGDSAAAMRYTEVRMSRISHEMLADLEKKTVDFVSNYDGNEQIPNIMPSKIPNLLINGASGIAVGMATNIPPHNLKEIIDGCLAFINNANISVQELMKYIPGPDFPTAGLIHGVEGIETAYDTGRGKIYIRAKVILETDPKTQRETIIINELPYQVNKSRLMEKIASLVREKRVDGISSLRDESDKDGIRVVIEIKRDAVGKIVLNNLYALTQLQISFIFNMVALHNGQPKVMSLKNILKCFIAHRREVIRRRTKFELSKACERISIVEAMLIALKNIEIIVKLIRTAPTLQIAKKNLISYGWTLNSFENKIFNIENIKNNITLQSNIKDNLYYFDVMQVQAILDLRLQKLTNLEKEKLLHEHQSLQIDIKKLIKILSSHESLMHVISRELKNIREKYGDVRRTMIDTNSNNINLEDLINREDVVVTLSYEGYIKYQPLSMYEAQHRGGKGKSAVRIKEKDFIHCLLVANTHDTILCFSSRGRVYWMKVYNLPEASRISRGRPIINLLPLDKDERITAMLPLHDYKKNFNVLMATSKGMVKKTVLTAFSRPRSTGVIAINLNKNDELIGVSLTDNTNEVMLFSAKGKVVRFFENAIRTVGRNTSGVRGIKLNEDDFVVSLIIPEQNKLILTITKNGYGKCTHISKYPTKSRATQGVISIKVTKRNGTVIGAVQVSSEDQIIIITDGGTLVRTRISEVSIVGRNTQGVVLIRIALDENVVALQCIKNKMIK